MSVGKTSIYNIAWKGIKEGVHEYSFRVDSKFFELIDTSMVRHGDVLAKVKFEKRSNLLTLHFNMEGTIELTCDRCLEKYNQPISHNASVFVKFGEAEADDGSDIFWISPEEDFINVAQLLYEFTVLSIPAKHVHPGDKDGNPGCNAEMLEQIEKYSAKEKAQEPDGRWDALKNLMNNN